MPIDSPVPEPRRGTQTRSFGASSRENHDSSAFYARSLAPVSESDEFVAIAEARIAGAKAAL